MIERVDHMIAGPSTRKHPKRAPGGARASFGLLALGCCIAGKTPHRMQPGTPGDEGNDLDVSDGTSGATEPSALAMSLERVAEPRFTVSGKQVFTALWGAVPSGRGSETIANVATCTARRAVIPRENGRGRERRGAALTHARVPARRMARVAHKLPEQLAPKCSTGPWYMNLSECT